MVLVGKIHTLLAVFRRKKKSLAQTMVWGERPDDNRSSDRVASQHLVEGRGLDCDIFIYCGR